MPGARPDPPRTPTTPSNDKSLKKQKSLKFKVHHHECWSNPLCALALIWPLGGIFAFAVAVYGFVRLSDGTETVVNQLVRRQPAEELEIRQRHSLSWPRTNGPTFPSCSPPSSLRACLAFTSLRGCLVCLLGLLVCLLQAKIGIVLDQLTMAVDYMVFVLFLTVLVHK